MIDFTRLTQNVSLPPCHPQPKAPVSSSTESEALRIGDPEIADWIPAFAGMTHLCHPQPKAKRFGLGIHSDWILAFAGMTEGCGNNGRGAGMTSGTRITMDELSITIKNPTGQAPRYSLF